MNMPMLIVVHPTKYDRETGYDLGACESDDALRERWLEVRATEDMLRQLGCERWDADRDRAVNFEVNGCNWTAGMSGSVWNVPPSALKALHAKYRELRKARETALAKLTDAECYSLGVTRDQKKRADPEDYVETLRDLAAATARNLLPELLKFVREQAAHSPGRARELEARIEQAMER